MEQLKIRLLTAREIECRVAQVGKKGDGVSLLLYKDARCDMAILDEIFGPMGWQRHHSRDNANCTVSIWDEAKGQWIDKEDVGTESNTEAIKGLASDSFKRACVNIGIGRELYTAPFIWITKPNCNIEMINGKYKCFDRYEVTDIGYNEHREINRLVIVNAKTKNVVFEYGTGKRKPQGEVKPQQPVEAPAPAPMIGEPATEEQKEYIRKNASDGDYMDIMTEFGAELENLSEADARRVINEIDTNNSDKTPRCTRCNAVITGQALPDGSTMTASEIVGKSKITYGGVFCWNCMKQLKRAKNKRKEAS